MSWDVVTDDKRTCPCGSGHYRVVVRSDGWGRSEQNWSMECPECEKNYALAVRHDIDSGMSVARFCWVPLALSQEVSALEGDARRQIEEVEMVARERYSEKWHRHFEGVAKKAIWTQLTDSGKEYPSLSTFYTHIREFGGLNAVLDRYFGLEYLPRMLRILGVMDDDLRERMTRIAQINAIHEARSEAMFHEA
jgi:hypothetical protein